MGVGGEGFAEGGVVGECGGGFGDEGVGEGKGKEEMVVG